MDMVQTPSCLWSSESLHNADVISWCPFTSDLFVCGTYELLEETRDRIGSLEVYHADGTKCKKIQSEMCPGVLDICWFQHSENYLAAALADGHLGLWKMTNEGQLNHCKAISSTFQNSIAMSLDSCILDTRCVAVCDAKGYLTLHDLSKEGDDPRQWKAHDFECWSVVFDKQNPSVLYSGGDDCLLKVWDLRGDLKRATMHSNAHSMGVTSIASTIHQEHTLATGSYDEKVFIWDNRQFKEPIGRCEVGGGVWRLKWHSSLKKLLAACMNAGFVVLNDDLSVMAEYKNHSSLAYGVDWGTISVKQDTTTQLIASCSFYDKSLQLWQVTYTE